MKFKCPGCQREHVVEGVEASNGDTVGCGNCGMCSYYNAGILDQFPVGVVPCLPADLPVNVITYPHFRPMFIRIVHDEKNKTIILDGVGLTYEDAKSVGRHKDLPGICIDLKNPNGATLLVEFLKDHMPLDEAVSTAERVRRNIFDAVEFIDACKELGMSSEQSKDLMETDNRFKLI